MRASVLVLAALVAAGCGDDVAYDPVVPPDNLVAAYDMTQLRFDPQGSLPDVDLRTRLEGSIPRLVLARNGAAQLVFTDPETRLVTISNATYTMQRSGSVRIRFDERSPLYRRIMLSEQMSFTFDEATGTLVFSDTSPDGVSRARLIQLVPELAQEQLFDPVPGQLTVVFAQN